MFGRKSSFDAEMEAAIRASKMLHQSPVAASIQENEDLQLALAISESEAQNTQKTNGNYQNHSNQNPSSSNQPLIRNSYAKRQQQQKQQEEDEKLAKQLQKMYQEDDYKRQQDTSGDEELSRRLQEQLDGIGGGQGSNSNSTKNIGTGSNSNSTNNIGTGSNSNSTNNVRNNPNACPGCGKAAGGIFSPCINAMGRNWHVECFRCADCGQPIKSHGGSIIFSISQEDGRPYHQDCYKRKNHPVCKVCGNYVPKRSDGLIQWSEIPFWKDKYCSSHTNDGTPNCSSCQRMQSRTDSSIHDWVRLNDGRHMCAECSKTMIMDTKDCQPLYDEIIQFFDNHGLTLPSKPPLMLVDQHGLNERSGNRPDGPLFHVRGLTMWEEWRMVSPVGGWLPMVGNHRSGNVTAILVVDGMPRLLTGSVLAHELMHAWFRLNNVMGLSSDVEEGMCQLMALLWIESQKIQQGSFEERAASYYRYKIRTDPTPTYGDGFRAAYDALQQQNGNLLNVVESVCKTGRFP